MSNNKYYKLIYEYLSTYSKNKNEEDFLEILEILKQLNGNKKYDKFIKTLKFFKNIEKNVTPKQFSDILNIVKSANKSETETNLIKRYKAEQQKAEDKRRANEEERIAQKAAAQEAAAQEAVAQEAAERAAQEAATQKASVINILQRRSFRVDAFGTACGILAKTLAINNIHSLQHYRRNINTKLDNHSIPKNSSQICRRCGKPSDVLEPVKATKLTKHISKDNHVTKTHITNGNRLKVGTYGLGRSLYPYYTEGNKQKQTKHTYDLCPLCWAYTQLITDDTREYSELLGGKKSTTKNPKKIRKHQGIYQRGPKKGKLKPGYKYSGQKTKTGLKIIVKMKK